MPEENTDPPAPETKVEEGSEGGPGGNLEELPSWARDAITKANKEAATYRTKAKELEPLASKAKQLEDANKTEMQKLTEALEASKAEGAKSTGALLKLEVALDKAPEGMSVAQVRKLAKRLTGSTKEELESDAEELFDEFKPAGTAGRIPGRPKERLRGGGDPTEEPEETDPRKLAARIPRRF